MIQPYTRLRVADNSGAREIRCIRVLKGNSHTAAVGDVIVTLPEAPSSEPTELNKLAPPVCRATIT